MKDSKLMISMRYSTDRLYLFSYSKSKTVAICLGLAEISLSIEEVERVQEWFTEVLEKHEE